MTDEDEIIKQEVVKLDNDEKTVYHYVNTERDIDIKTREVYKKSDKTVLFQLKVEWGTNSVVPKYDHLEKINLIGFRSKIPQGFSKSASRGYKPLSDLTPLIKFITDNSTIKQITISKTAQTSLSNNQLTINHKDFELIKRHVKSARRISNEEIKDFIQNHLSGKFPGTFPTAPRKYRKGTIFRVLSSYKNIEKMLSVDDRRALFELFEKVSPTRKSLFEKRNLIITREKIEKKFIEDILEEFKRLISLKSIKEGRWQDFFKENAWIFSQLFAYPTVLFEDQAYVGGKSIKDKEGKYVDFLYQNKLTKNSAIIEIKKHTTRLLNKKPYRGSNVFTMDKEFSGGISQVLDQKAIYGRKFDSIRGGDDIQSFNPRCILVIGRMSKLTKEQQECFELIRSNLQNLDVITFDELLEKIETVLSIFKNEEEEK